MDLFTCEKLHVRLTTSACGQRWRGANSADASPDLRHSVCRDCPIGKSNVVHAAALRAKPRKPPVHFPDAPPKETTMREPTPCRECGKPVEQPRTGRARQWCTDCGTPTKRARSGAAPKAPKPAARPEAPPKSTALARSRPALPAIPAETGPLTSLDAVADAAAVRQIRAHRSRLVTAFDLVLAAMGGEVDHG